MVWKRRRKRSRQTQEYEVHYSSKSSKFLLGGRRRFRGAVVDTGAPTSVIGRKEAELYCAMFGIRLKLLPSSRTRTFRFRSKVYVSLGEIKVIIPTTTCPFVFHASVISLDIPLLLGLDTLTEMKLDISPADRTLTCAEDGSKYPLVYDGHLVLR